MRIRRTKNSAGNISIQVGNYRGKYFELVKHIGSARSDIEEKELIKKANEFITQNQLSLFVKPLKLDRTDFTTIGYSRTKAYEYFRNAFNCVFPKIQNKSFMDLVIIRLVNPTSKLESIELLKEYFGVKYAYASLYRQLMSMRKEDLINALIDYAKSQLSFNFSLLFYDVTTLYFESKPDDNLKMHGFSKDGKHNQPQILIGLVVDENGFPIYYEIFKGNSFEGHTMLPVILTFQQSFNIKNLTVIADSAMLSEENLLTLESNSLNYIVGNRTITTYRSKLDSQIMNLKIKNNSSFRISDGNRYVIYHYSSKREKKDFYEIEKATKKAEYLSRNPSKQSRAKYLRAGYDKSEVNYDLIEKHKFLAGIKSYKTNTDLESNLVVDRYSDLWKVEKAFRMSKHDLKARPIFHRKAEAIQAHIQIVFAANAVARHIELTTRDSIKNVVKQEMRQIQVKFKLKDSDEIITLDLQPH